MPSLIATEGPLKGQRFVLGAETIMGRAEEATIQVADLMVTRRHCRITATAAGYLIEDLGSRNGTHVNQQPIKAPTVLHDGDTVRVNTAVFRFAEENVAPRDMETIPDDGGTIVDVSEQVPSTITDAIPMAVAGLDGQSVRATATPESLSKAHQRLKTVVEIGKCVGSQVELNSLLREVLDSFFRVFPHMDRGFIMLRQPGTNNMEVRLASQRDLQKPRTISVSRHIISEAARRRIGILSADAMVDSRFAGAGSVINYRIRSMMCAPLIAADELLGIIHVDTMRQDRRFNHEDLEMFTAVANQIALAITYTRLNEKLRERQRMEHELAMARQVQHSFLPACPPQMDGMDFAASYRAAREVGGDFYDFITLADGRMAIVLGDVMGKGMPAALMMVRMMSDIRSLAAAENQPGRILARLNDGLTLRESDTSFVTMLLMVLDPATRKLTFANAAHWPPLLSKGLTGAFTPVETVESGFAIGTVSGAEYPQADLQLGPGDTLLLYTDGITEAENAREEFFGAPRLLKSIAVPNATPAGIIEKLLADLQLFTGPTAQSDDITVLCMAAK